MSFGGFGKNSGPSTQPVAQTAFGNSPRHPSPSSPFPVLPRSNEPPLRWGNVKTSSLKDPGAQYQRPPTALQQVDSRNLRTASPSKIAEVQSNRRMDSSYSEYPHEISVTSRTPMYSDKRYMELSPPVFHNNPYVGGQRPNFQEVQQRPFSPMGVNRFKLSSHNAAPPVQERISPVMETSGPIFQTKHADGSFQKRTQSPTLATAAGFSPENARFGGHERTVVDYRDLDAPESMSATPVAFEISSSRREPSRPFVGTQKPFPSSNMHADQSKSPINNTYPLVREDVSGVLTTRASYISGRKLQAEHADVPLPKRTRSPTSLPTNGNFLQNPASVLETHKRGPGFQRRSQSPTSAQAIAAEDDANKPMDIPAVKRTKIPHLSSSDLVSQVNLHHAEEIDRELHAKAKRLARFKDELSQPVPSGSTITNPKDPAKSQHLSVLEKQKISEDPKMDMMVDSTGGNVYSDYEGIATSTIIVGLCPDMCPESERSERERKGDLDQYERLDGDRNVSSEHLAVKKYTRTAEREAELIRPLPILQKTIDYVLNLLDGPYDDKFLGLYNFLWDRMRAIRMDLRMQHIFNLEAITMLEQMIRLHIIAMHELCEFTKGEGFSEGFDAHLNIEQMNKTSVELFQFYDDHRKKGIHVQSEREFRGYYALLKLDKHPGYKVEPAELSLDLAKMTPEMRQTPEVLFARNVARACRTGNFIAFFRLARKASYLQACLMHAHFSKLRTQALASLHSGLQIHQGIPITQVAKWLGMEDEDIGDLLEYYGFKVGEYEEPYMVKENAFANVENDFPVKRSKLVDRKRSKMVVTDVMFPSLIESCADDEVIEFRATKDPLSRPTSSPIVAISTPQLQDGDMHGFATSLSPKSNMQNPMHRASISPTTPDLKTMEVEIQEASGGPSVSDFFRSSPKPHDNSVESARKFKYEPAFRNSFGRSLTHDLEATSVTTEAAVTQVTVEENGCPVVPFDSVLFTPIPEPVLPEDMEDEELAEVGEEDTTDAATTSNYDTEIWETKLRLMLRRWKRCTTNRIKLREHKKFTANAALELLSLGPPIFPLEVHHGSFETFNIDHVMRERHETQQKSWSVLNPSDVVASKLVEKSPDAKCLCWKMLLCSLETVDQNNLGLQNGAAQSSAASSWLLSKLMPADSDGSNDLLVSSPGLAIWRSWIPSQSNDDLACCLSVIKKITSVDMDKSIKGASAILFLLSEGIPLELQRKRLHDLIVLLPSGSRLPLLILSEHDKYRSDLSGIAKVLGLHDIDESRVTVSCITFLKSVEMEGLDGFFSDKHLREGLEWLARESPPQIEVRREKMRERVLSHLNSILKILDGMGVHRVSPNDCISVFNEALDRSMKEVAATAHANPTDWPCPEINLLEEFSDECRATKCYLPSVGWSSASRTEVLMAALNDCRLPSFEDDLSWLSRGLGIGVDIRNQKSQLENCLVGYLTQTSQMMGEALAQQEVALLTQNFTLLELQNTTYYITPRWVSIFRRIFNWRLMRLNREDLASTYRLISAPNSEDMDSLESQYTTLPPPYIVQPSLDEMVEGLESNQMDREAPRPWPSVASGFPSSSDNVILMEENSSPQNGMLTISCSNSAMEENEGSLLVLSSEAPKEAADELSKLLEQCNIIQNQIDKKLSIYF